MGYNLGSKTLAIGLLALCDGDPFRAKRVWKRIQYEEPEGFSDALELVMAALIEEPAETNE